MTEKTTKYILYPVSAPKAFVAGYTESPYGTADIYNYLASRASEYADVGCADLLRGWLLEAVTTAIQLGSGLPIKKFVSSAPKLHGICVSHVMADASHSLNCLQLIRFITYDTANLWLILSDRNHGIVAHFTRESVEEYQRFHCRRVTEEGCDVLLRITEADLSFETESSLTAMAGIRLVYPEENPASATDALPPATQFAILIVRHFDMADRQKHPRALPVPLVYQTTEYRQTWRLFGSLNWEQLSHNYRRQVAEYPEDEFDEDEAFYGPSG